MLRHVLPKIVRANAGAPLARGLSTASDLKLPSYVLNGPKTDVSSLKNGVRVATEAGHGETATIGVFINTGSRHETAETNGVAHFLEHMAFKGTPNMNQKQLEVEFENMGGHLNAYTTREQTVYYAKVFKEDIPRAVNILSDMITNPLCDEAAMDRERSVILRESEEVKSIPEEVIFDLLHETAYQGSSLGRDILGSDQNIKTISKGDILNYIKTHYTGPRIVVAGAGAVDHSQLVGLTEKTFGTLPQNPPNGLVAKVEPTHFVGSELRIRDDDLPLAHVAVAFETGGWTDPHSFPLMIMQTILGNWDRTMTAGANMASSLCRKVGENNLAHSLKSFRVTYNDTGLFGVFAAAEPHTLWDLSSNIMYEMVRLSYQPTTDEVERAKVQLKSAILSDLDGSTAVCEDIGRQLLTYGRRMTPAEMFARIDAVDVNAVKAAARAVVNDKDLVLAGVGNVHELPDINWFRRRTYWLRF